MGNRGGPHDAFDRQVPISGVVKFGGPVGKCAD